MLEEKKAFFDKSEQMLKASMKKFKAEGEDEFTAVTLALYTLEKIFQNNGLNNDFYKAVLADLETMYTFPVKTYAIYKKYGITT